MSEIYTTGGDTLQRLGLNYYAAQSFTPIEAHTLSYVDINLRTVHPTRVPVINIHYADYFHKPSGGSLSHSFRYYADNWNLNNVFRMRAQMTPYLLREGREYCIVVHAYAIDSPWHLQWQYDAGDATYPRGMRSISTDGGNTWATRENDDHIFAEFGDPPLAKPEPPPPVANFAIPRIEYTPYSLGILIRIATSVPCHLTLYWTDKQPLKHHTTRIVRGLKVPWATYFCFVAWHAVEQNEPGDTLYHTFSITPWIFCQTRWFTFRGEVNDLLTPSVGPIFEYHHPGNFLFEHYITGDLEAGSFYSIKWLAQSFTPSTAHKITSVKLKLYRRGLPGTITVGIRATDDEGIPTGEDLCLGTTDGNTLPNSPPGEWREITLGAGALLIAGKQYAIVARIDGGDVDNAVLWRDDASYATYPGGMFLERYTEFDWYKWPAFDFMFEEWGNIP